MEVLLHLSRVIGLNQSTLISSLSLEHEFNLITCQSRSIYLARAVTQAGTSHCILTSRTLEHAHHVLVSELLSSSRRLSLLINAFGCRLRCTLVASGSCGCK